MEALPTGTLTGVFEDLVATTLPIRGTIYFLPEADYLVTADGILPTSVVEFPVGNGDFALNLVATDNPAVSPVDWTYRVSFALTVDDSPVTRAPFSIHVPAGEVIDFATVPHVAPYQP